MPNPGGLVATTDGIWVQNGKDGSLWKLSETGEVLLKVPDVSQNAELFYPGVGGGGNSTLATAFGSVWSLVGDSLFRIEPSGEVVAEITVPQRSTSLAVDDGFIWVICNACFARIDPASNELVEKKWLGTTPGGATTGLGALWISLVSEAGGVLRIDPENVEVGDQYPGELIYGPAFYNPGFMVVAGNTLWTTDRSGSLEQADPQSGNVLTKLDIPPPIVGLAANDTTILINAGELMTYDVRSAELRSIAPMGHTEWANGGVAAAFGYVWASSPELGKVVAFRT